MKSKKCEDCGKKAAIIDVKSPLCADCYKKRGIRYDVYGKPRYKS